VNQKHICGIHIDVKLSVRFDSIGCRGISKVQLFVEKLHCLIDVYNKEAKKV
jgi:hypothetical protein